MQEVELEEGAYDLTDPKHPTFMKRYQGYLKNNNVQHSSAALQGFINAGGKSGAKMKNEEYDIESMLEELETQLDEGLFGKLNAAFKEGARQGAIEGAKKYIKPQHHSKYDLNNIQSMEDAKKVISKAKENGHFNDNVNEETEKLDNPIVEMIDTLMRGQLTESNALFYDLLSYKINEQIEERKISIAKSLFGESHDEDEDDKSDEVNDEEENSHPLIQLKKIASSEEGIPLKYPEVTASGEPDKRSIRAATDRIKSGKSTSGIPKFKHKNGEESTVHPEHAKHLVDILSGSSLKPDTKKQVLDHIHGSKAGLEKVSSVLTGVKPKEKSIYGSDART